MASYSIDPLDIHKIPQARTIMIIGKRNTGKTTLLADICYHRQQMQFGITFAGSIGSRLAVAQFHPDTFIYDTFDPDVLANFWRHVRKTNGALRRRGQPMLDMWCILDDTGFEDKMRSDRTLREIMMNGRQYNLTIIVCLQDGKSFHPNMRSQVDYVFILKAVALEVTNKIWDTFAGGHFPDKITFLRVLRECTRNYRALVIKNSDIDESEGDFDGSVFFYKAKPQHRPFTIGSDDMWRHHFKVYNEHYESDEENKSGGSGGESASATAVSARRRQPARVVCNAKARRRVARPTTSGQG